jgi:hypothetical protein
MEITHEGYGFPTAVKHRLRGCRKINVIYSVCFIVVISKYNTPHYFLFEYMLQQSYFSSPNFSLTLQYLYTCKGAGIYSSVRPTTGREGSEGE